MHPENQPLPSASESSHERPARDCGSTADPAPASFIPPYIHRPRLLLGALAIAFISIPLGVILLDTPYAALGVVLFFAAIVGCAVCCCVSTWPRRQISAANSTTPTIARRATASLFGSSFFSILGFAIVARAWLAPTPEKPIGPSQGHSSHRIDFPRDNSRLDRDLAARNSLFENVNGSAIQNKNPGRDQTQLEAQRGRAQLASAHWQATIHHLHLYRYGHPQNPEEEFQAYYERLLEGYQAHVEQAKLAPHETIDADLRGLSSRLLGLDERSIAWAKDFQQLLKARGIDMSGVTVANQFQALERLQTEITDDQVAALPEDAQQFLAQYVVIEEERLALYHEIELMQARLEERYPGTSFPLPDLEEVGL
jgi:hypothetical protein